VRVPSAPEITGVSAAWAALTAVAVLVISGLLAEVWQPLALIPSLLLLIAAVYLIGGELWENRRAQGS
jgi:ABC-type Fe3+-siderophore transport system permease subunit